jgi:hypothetical protein
VICREYAASTEGSSASCSEKEQHYQAGDSAQRYQSGKALADSNADKPAPGTRDCN